MLSKRNKAILLLIITSILWSTGGLFIKLIPWHPIAISSGRSFTASILMFIFLVFKLHNAQRDQNTTLRAVPQILSHLKNPFVILGGISGASLYLLFVAANKLTSAGNAIVLQFTAPIWVILFSGVFLHKKPSLKDLLAVLFVFLGIGLFFIESLGHGHFIGDVLAVVAGMFMAIQLLFLKSKKVTEPVVITFLGNLLTFFIGLPFLISAIKTPTALAYILFLGLLQIGVSYILYSYAVRYVTSLEALFITVIEPLLNPLWVYLMTGETIGKLAILGSIIVLATVLWHSMGQTGGTNES